MRVVVALLCAVLSCSVAGPALAAPSDAADAADAARRRLATAAAEVLAGQRGVGATSVPAAPAEEAVAAAQATTRIRLDDASGDPEVTDRRGDLTATWLDRSRGHVVRVAARTASYESPTSYAWSAGVTGVTWFLDTDGDAEDEYAVLAFTVEGRPTGAVLRSSDLELACMATFTYSARTGYGVELPSSCIGDPASARFAAVASYDTHPDDPDAPVSADVAPDAARWSPWVSAGPRPHRHAKPAVRRDATFWLRDDLGRGVTDVRATYGVASDVGLLCDWDGDGTKTVGVFRGGRWWVSDGIAGGGSRSFTYGYPGDVPLCGDWDGDGRDTPGAYRAGRWYLRPHLTGGASATTTYGLASDRPVVGDWDGDGRDTIGVVRGDTWHLRAAGGGTAWRFAYGYAADDPVVGDWDGDGRDTPGVFRDGEWLVRNQLASGRVDWGWAYGIAGDTPLVWR